MKLSIVIPVFNEEKCIASTISETLKQKRKLVQKKDFSSVEIIAVNDGSTDSSLKLLKKFEKEIKIINLQKNSGYGAALKKGFSEAKGDLIAFFDADGTYPINELSALSEKLVQEKADMIIGSRLSKNNAMPSHRYYGNKFFGYFLSTLSNGVVSDTASGMRVFRKKIASSFSSLPNGLEFTPAMTTMLMHENVKIIEHPIAYYERVGNSKLNSFNHGIAFFASIINQAKLYNPLKLFGAIGAVFIILAVFFFFQNIIIYQTLTEFSIRRILFILMFLLVGINLIFFGFLANFTIKLFYDQLHTAIVYKWAYDRYLLTKYNILGIVLFAVGLIFMFIFSYSDNWSAPLIGLLLVLLGTQLMASSMIVRILKELYEKRIRMKK
ncbi:MAG: glycosyltransferase family 2 protein [archaeon]|nr:glycosyltransferase family 2 protein [archaeon]